MNSWNRLQLCVMVFVTFASPLAADDTPCDVCPQSRQLCGVLPCTSSDCASPLRASDRWLAIPGCFEEWGIEFEGAVSQFYQGVGSGGIERKFRYGGHADYEMSFDFGRICGLDRWALELGAEHRFAETVNLATGSVIPVAVAPSLPSPTTNDLALTKVRFACELHDNFEAFFGKIDALDETSNAFADGNGTERFFGSSFNFYTIAVRTVPFSTLAAGVNVISDEERLFTLAVLNTKDTATTVGISDLFTNGAVIFTELRLPVTVGGRRGASGDRWQLEQRDFYVARARRKNRFPRHSHRHEEWVLGLVLERGPILVARPMRRSTWMGPVCRSRSIRRESQSDQVDVELWRRWQQSASRARRRSFRSRMVLRRHQ